MAHKRVNRLTARESDANKAKPGWEIAKDIARSMPAEDFLAVVRERCELDEAKTQCCFDFVMRKYDPKEEILEADAEIADAIAAAFKRGEIVRVKE